MKSEKTVPNMRTETGRIGASTMCTYAEHRAVAGDKLKREKLAGEKLTGGKLFRKILNAKDSSIRNHQMQEET